MFNAVKKHEGQPLDSRPHALPTSRLFSELLDINHDAWRVFKNGNQWTFYREIGEQPGLYPSASIVLTTEVGKPQTLDLYTRRGRRSLMTSYGDEVPRAAQELIDRERIISLYSKLAYHLDPSSWDHNLSFAGVDVTERRVALRSDAPVYGRIVGDIKARLVGGARGTWKTLPHSGVPGIKVSEYEGGPPLVEYDLTYPRPLAGKFFSTRLRQGLHYITCQMVSMVVDHNRGVERREKRSDCDEWD